MNFKDQLAAQRLAMCNDIGEASYVDSLVAAELVETLRSLRKGDEILATIQSRFGIGMSPDMTGMVSDILGFWARFEDFGVSGVQIRVFCKTGFSSGIREEP